MVVPSKGSLRGETATTAGGGTLVNRGKCTIHGSFDGQFVEIPFQDMDVELAMASIQTCVKPGRTVTFHENGGKSKSTNRRNHSHL